eukprot:NODE_1584_length_1121_cov_82.745336_g1292_i0.p1 GENE.NODE_1584_length_1121_cov_82.745336_g1292_i0~~NODE_1584_length_1121_cov_82.745336_g1292_i0.p1  ORF type:complete len:130 (+),score=34.53 NODE_1584_length_1121_cov_82.745336_g1292_i0:262-651(+)
MGHPLVPPFRTRLVEDGILVGAYPTLRNFRYLRRQRLKLVISLTPEEPTADLAEFCEAEGVKVHYQAAERFKDGPAMFPNDFAEVVAKLIDPANHPIFMHCLDGGNVSGQVVMVLRKLMCWSMSSSTEE